MTRSGRTCGSLPVALLALVVSSACSSDPGSGAGATSTGTSLDTAATGTGPNGSGGTDGTDGTEGTEGTGVVPPTPCETTEDCEGELVCDCIGRCVPPGIAEIPMCLKDINCGSGNYCDGCAAVCRPLKTLCEPCEDHHECADGGLCLDFESGGRFCLKACVADPGCPVGAYSCRQVPGQIDKQCVPLSKQCSKPELCADDTECPFGDICELGQCKPGCPHDDVCPDGSVCTAFRCVKACSADNPCPGGQECDDSGHPGHCKIEGGCLEPKDCPEPETYCDPTQNLCQPGCLADFDCKSSAKECVDGSCAPKGCTGNFFCAFEEVCDLGTGQCKKAEGPYCKEGCDPQNGSTSCGEGNQCLSLQDEDGNALGDFCFVGCGPDPNNACPQGYACKELEHPEQGVLKLCIRDCTTTPLGVE